MILATKLKDINKKMKSMQKIIENFFTDKENQATFRSQKV